LLNTTKELLDIATQHVSGKEVIGAFFYLGDGKTVPGSSGAAPSKVIGKGTKGGRNGPKWCPQRVAVTTSSIYEDQEVDDSDEEYVMTAKSDFKR
jgi:hypothetical protein